MGSLSYEDLANLQPKNMTVRAMIRTLRDTRYPMEVLPDEFSPLDRMEYPIFSSTNTAGLNLRIQGEEAKMTGGDLTRAIIQAEEYAEKMQIRENDSQILVNVRNEIVDTLTDISVLRKQELKWKHVDNNGATRDTTNAEDNAYTGTGIQGANPAAFDGYYLVRDATTQWNDDLAGDPFADIGAAKRRVQESVPGATAQWAVMSSRVAEVLMGRADIQKAVRDGIASQAGGNITTLRGLTVREVDILEKGDRATNSSTETFLNRENVQVTIEGSRLGLTHVSERMNFVTIDMLNLLRSVQIEIREKYRCFLQRFVGSFTLQDVVDN